MSYEITKNMWRGALSMKKKYRNGAGKTKTNSFQEFIYKLPQIHKSTLCTLLLSSIFRYWTVLPLPIIQLKLVLLYLF